MHEESGNNPFDLWVIGDSLVDETEHGWQTRTQVSYYFRKLLDISEKKDNMDRFKQIAIGGLKVTHANRILDALQLCAESMSAKRCL